MNLLNFLNIENQSNLDIIKAETIKVNLNKFLSHQIHRLGLFHWDKSFQWSGEFNQDGIKHIIEYVPLKGVSGTFQYGNSFNFIPSVNNKGKFIANHKRLQLIERTKGWQESLETSNTKTAYRVSHWNEYFFNKTLPLIFNSEKTQIEDWFNSNKDLEQNIQTALKQINSGGAYNLNSPSQKVILAFLYAKNGEMKLAKNTLNDYYVPLIKLRDDFKIEYEEIEKSLNNV